MRIVMMGPPGAGKGTQAQLLARKLGIPHVATGEVFRKHISSGTPIGRRAKEFVESGRLVPDEVTNEMVCDEIQAVGGLGFVLDGYPRNVAQAEYLDKRLRKMGKKLGVVVYLAVAVDELSRRLSGRLVCPDCHATYHQEAAPSKVSNRCDRCGATLKRRTDDTPEIISTRLAVYQQETEPLLKYYQRRGLMVDIDGMGKVEEVHQRLLQVVRAREATNSDREAAKSGFGRGSAKQVNVSLQSSVSSIQRGTKDESPGTRGMTMPRGFLGSSVD